MKVRDPKENVRKLVLQRWTLKRTSMYVVLTGMTLTVLDGEAFTAPLFGHDHKAPLGSIIDQHGTNPDPEARCAAPVSRDNILNDYWLDMSCDASGTNGGNGQRKHVSCILARDLGSRSGWTVSFGSLGILNSVKGRSSVCSAPNLCGTSQDKLDRGMTKSPKSNMHG